MKKKFINPLVLRYPLLSRLFCVHRVLVARYKTSANKKVHGRKDYVFTP